MSAALEQRVGELERRMANTNRIGTVDQLDLDAKPARMRVKYATDEQNQDVLTGWLHWFELMAGSDRSWSVPEQGEQVMLLAPGGDLAQAVVLRGIPQDKYPAHADEAKDWRIDWANGDFMHHDRETGVMTLKVKKLHVPDGDIVAKDVSLIKHDHGGVKRGFSRTDKP